ncbi:MAG: cytochrome c3 family protein [Bdellovibrionales bacterium]
MAELSLTVILAAWNAGADVKIQHFPEAKKCTTCHVAKHTERLQLLTGDRTESVPELCGQCHGIVKRNWDAGMHGKQVGGWRNSSPMDCRSCHDPHDPKFKPMAAKPAPVRPRLGIKKGESNE